MKAFAQLLAKGQSIGEKPFAETKNGYKLDGIYSDNSFNTAVDASYVPSGDTALYYKWGTITVSVADKDGNIVNTFELSTKSYNQGLFTALKVSDPAPESDANEDVSE